MTPTLTLGDLRSVVAPSLNRCPEDADVPSYINRAQERLMNAGDWVGTSCIYRICVADECLVFPRPVLRLTVVAIDETPIPVRNSFFEFLENGPGFQASTGNGSGFCSCGGSQVFDRGTTCLYQDIKGTAKKLKVYADVDEDASAKIIFRGHDENLNWIQTEIEDNVWMEGEQISINSATPQVSTKLFYPPGPQIVLKDVTRGPVRVYSYDTSTDPPAQEPIAIYEPGETRPSYRRVLIPGISGSTGDNGCRRITLTAHVKLRHIDMVADADTAILQNREAIRLAAMAIRKEELNLFQEAQLYWQGLIDPVTRRRFGGAIPLLEEELANHHGPGVISPIRFESPRIFGASVPNIM